MGQFRQPHNVFPRVRIVLEEELPHVAEALVAAGCAVMDPMAQLPPSIEDPSPRPGDDRFWYVTGRRPVVESVFATSADETRRVEVRRGVRVAGLLTGPPVAPATPHVTGVVTADGEEIAADLVIDAMGRRTKLTDWLTAAGARPPELLSEDSGFVYYSRYFHGENLPPLMAPPVCEIGTISTLTLPGDNGTWSVTVYAAAADEPLKRLRDPDRFDAVVRACLLQAHWLDGERITDVLAMAGILDRHRRFVVDGAPVATGVLAVGDAVGVDEPVGWPRHQRRPRPRPVPANVVQDGLDDPDDLARTWDAVTATEVAPFVWHQLAEDRVRIAEMDALRLGAEPPPPDPTRQLIQAGTPIDADVFRAMLDMRMCLAQPEVVLARPGLAEKLTSFAGTPVFAIPGPDRPTLLSLLG